MDIFKGLFRNFLEVIKKVETMRIKTPYKVQVMRKGLIGMNVECAGRVYRLLVPKRLYKKYADAQNKVDRHKELTPMERTRLYGYLNPKYHVANYPRKRVH